MNVITDREALEALVQHYSTKPWFVFDVETMGEDKERKNPHIAQVVWISLACDDRADAIPMGHPHGEMIEDRMALRKSGKDKIAAGKTRDQLKPYDFSTTEHDPLWEPAPPQLLRYEVTEALRPLFFGAAKKIGHNVKFDLHAMTKYYDEVPPGPYYDTMIASWVLDVTLRGSLGLADCYERETGGHLEKGVGSDIRKHSFLKVAEYSYLDAVATREVYLSLQKKIAKIPEVRRLVHLEMQVMAPVLEMENSGVRLDLDRLGEISVDLQNSIDVLEGQIYAAAGKVFNINSTPQKQRLLFGSKSEGNFGMRPLKPTPGAKDKDPDERTVTDWSVDAQTMEKLALGKTRGAGMVRLMLQHSAKVKIKGTYVVPYLDPKTAPDLLRYGRIHASFVQNGAETGRFSSRKPNLQNIPSRSEDGRQLRDVFVADPLYDIIAADYSQIEPRIIASLSGDKTMVQTYRDGGDVYQAVADRMLVARPIGKLLVLAIAYGVHARTIAERLGVTVSEAESLMEFFDAKFPSINRHKAKVVAKARKNRYSSTVMGRRRPLPQFGWRDFSDRSRAERQAYNHLIQGTAADIMKIALVNIWAAIPQEARLLMTVHDEVVLQVPKELTTDTVQTVKEEMEGVRMPGIVVPMVADVGTGASWGEAK